MAFREKATEGAVESREQSNNGDFEDDEMTLQEYGIDVDFDEVPFVRQSPTTFITGEFPSLDEGNPIIRFRNEKYEEGRSDQGYLGLVLDDPEVVVDEDEGTEGTIILQTDDQDSTDVRLFNADDDDTKVIDGMGVKFGDRLYEGEVLDEFPNDRLLLTVSGASSKNVAKRLDKRGDVDAGMDEESGGVNDGLIEYKPFDLRDDEDNNEVTSRYARDPELKTDLHGDRVGIFLARREDLDNENTGYVGVEGDAEEDTPLLGETDAETHTDWSEASYAELVADDNQSERGMYWYVVFNVDEEEEIEVEETDDDVIGYTYLEDDWGQFDPSVGGIPDDQWEFVEEYVEAADEGDLATDEETIRENINENAEEFEDEAEVDSMVNAITNRV